MLKFLENLIIGGFEWQLAPFRFNVHAINDSGTKLTYVQFITSDNEDFITSDDDNFLVKE